MSDDVSPHGQADDFAQKKKKKITGKKYVRSETKYYEQVWLYLTWNAWEYMYKV